MRILSVAALLFAATPALADEAASVEVGALHRLVDGARALDVASAARTLAALPGALVRVDLPTALVRTARADQARRSALLKPQAR